MVSKGKKERKKKKKKKKEEKKKIMPGTPLFHKSVPSKSYGSYQ